MFFSLSVLNLEDHLGLVISPQSPLSAGYITLRACRRSLPLRFSTVTPGGIVGFLIVSYRFNIPDRLAVHLSIHARPELRAHLRKTVVAHVFGERTMATLGRLMSLLSPFDVVIWMTDGWPLYESRLKGKLHVISKRYTQRIERHNLNLRQHLARAARQILFYQTASAF